MRCAKCGGEIKHGFDDPYCSRACCEGDTEWARFVDLTRALVQVPKSGIAGWQFGQSR